MNWAKEYGEQEQFGRLAISRRWNPTGETVWVMVLPENVAAKWNGAGNAPLNDDGVVVFGPTDKTNRQHDWRHDGPWQDDIFDEADRRSAMREEMAMEEKARAERREAEKRERDQAMLATYKREKP